MFITNFYSLSRVFESAAMSMKDEHIVKYPMTDLGPMVNGEEVMLNKKYIIQCEIL